MVHGRPTGRRLQDGDLLSIDCGAIVDGWHGDAAVTVHVGEVLEDDARLLQATELALAAGIAAAVPGSTLLDVATAVDDVARAHGYAHLPDHGGHGIGRAMHEAPFVPNEPTSDAARHRLRAGNTIAIEPMLHAGSRTSSYRTKKDGWLIVTTDGKRAAHVENTVAVTDAGPEIRADRADRAGRIAEALNPPEPHHPNGGADRRRQRYAPPNQPEESTCLVPIVRRWRSVLARAC